MTFDEILTQVVATLQQQGRVSYGALKRRFGLDDDYLQDIRDELISAQQLAVDERGKILVWTGKERQKETGKREQQAVSSQLSVLSSSQPPASQTLNSELQTPDSEDSRVPSSQSADAPRSALHALPAEGEHRPLTVMFCGFLDPERNQTNLEAEELSRLIRQQQTTCTAVIARYEGYIAQYLSEGLLVYFGYPTAHENDAHRAVRAGLEIVQALRRQVTKSGEQERRQSLQIRIGIHTGTVIVGAMGDDNRREHLALDETSKIAAHLQNIVDPSPVVLSAATYRLVKNDFFCQLIGKHAVQGLPAASEIYRVDPESIHHSRREAAPGTTLPLVGRKEELQLLLKRWEQAQEGRGQVVLLSGEAGIGKSRLLVEVRNRLATSDVLRLVLRCSPYHQHSAFYPLLDLAHRTLHFTQDDSPQEKLRKLQQTLSMFHLEETLPFFATFLELPTAQPPLTHLTPQKQRETVMRVIVNSWIAAAERQPMLVVWEDLQWADPSTLDLLRLFVDQIPLARIFAVLTFRSDFTLLWAMRSHITPLMLDRLGKEQVTEIVEKVTGHKALPMEVIQQIVLKTDGVPLFVEELTKMVLESGLVKERGDRYELTGPLPPLAIPATLQDSLFARLDRLAEAREVVQLAATLGREFSYDLLNAVSANDEQTLSAALAKLTEAEVLHRHGVPPHVKFVFKHALIQDAAYQSLLKNKRQLYHQRVARVLEEHFPKIRTEQPELIARHYTEAGLDAQAVSYWQKAGQQALARSAFAEAINHLSRGLEALHLGPDSPECALQELDFRAMLGPTLMAVKGYGAPEVEQSYARALDLCQQIGETPRLLQVLSGLQIFYLTRGEIRTARELGERCLSLAQREQNLNRLVQVHLVLGNTLFQMGELNSAHEHLTQGLVFYHRSPKHGSYRALQDPAVDSLCYLALILWCRGYPDQAVQKSTEALALAEKLARPLSLAIAQIFAAQVHSLCQEWDLVLKYAEATIMLATEQELPQWGAYASIYRGWALAEQGHAIEGIAEIERGLALSRATGAEAARPWFLSALANAHLILGQPEKGLAVVEEALLLIDTKGERIAEVELYRLKGELLLTQEVKSQKAKSKKQKAENLDPQSALRNLQSEAETYFLRALTLAQQRDMKLWELRATVGLCRLWQTQGKRAEARQLLAPLFSWFTEGLATKDLQETRSLLEALETS